ncbi:hypothetical protein [Roseovarius faecimaris]|uniref:hypothetical protein n=1 Tax=Roseovarius faecimaris TaxID=2494550 RepID=UPI0012FE6210|nr:hypothetical protein [Roseovarius faecimaris]
MNANQLINMVIRQIMRRVVRGGVDAGFNAVNKRMAKGNDLPMSARKSTGDNQNQA